MKQRFNEIKKKFLEFVKNNNIPNKISFSRMKVDIFLGALFLGAININIPFTNINPNYFRMIFALFSITALSDRLDGFLAGKSGHRTNTGKSLDPISDKMLVNPTLIAMAVLGMLPPIIPMITMARDAIVDSIRMKSSKLKDENGKPKVIAASQLGRVKSAITMIGIGAMALTFGPIDASNARIYAISQLVIYLGTAFSIISGIIYFVKYQKIKENNNEHTSLSNKDKWLNKFKTLDEILTKPILTLFACLNPASILPTLVVANALTNPFSESIKLVCNGNGEHVETSSTEKLRNILLSSGSITMLLSLIPNFSFLNIIGLSLSAVGTIYSFVETAQYYFANKETFLKEIRSTKEVQSDDIVNKDSQKEVQKSNVVTEEPQERKNFQYISSNNSNYYLSNTYPENYKTKVRTRKLDKNHLDNKNDKE